MRVRQHRLLRSAALSLLLCVPFALTSCSHRPRSGETNGPRLPTVLPLPDDPERLLYVESPQRYLDELTVLGNSPDLVFELLSSVLAEWIGDEPLADAIINSLDWSRPLAVVELGLPETIISIPLRPEPDPALQVAIDALSREGTFGARALATPSADPARPRFVWRDGDELALATSVRGLATATLLRERYNTSPIRVVAHALPGIPRVKGFDASGTVEAIDLNITMESVEELLSSRSARGGALTSLANHRAVALGGTFAWTGSDAWIHDTAALISETIAEQPFLIRGFVEKIGRRANSLLRTWDGRCFVGISSEGGLMVGLGSRDPKTSGVAMLRLAGGIAKDLSLLKSFFDGAPSVSLKKNIGDAAGEPIHRITVADIRSKVPSEFREFLDERGRLQVYFAFSRHTGAGMFVVGDRGLSTLRGWLKDSAEAPGLAAYQDDLVAIRTSIPILALRDVSRENLLERFRSLPKMPRARSLTVSSNGANSVLIRYRSDKATSAPPVPAQAKARPHAPAKGEGPDQQASL